MNPSPNRELPSLSTSLLDRVQQMEPDAWNRLVETFSPIVYRWCRQSGLEQGDSADVVQEVFLSVARGIGNFERQKETGSFRSWLATITRNRIRDLLRTGHKIPNAQGGTEFLNQVKQVPDELDQSITETQLNQALPQQIMQLVEAEVEPRTWRAFWQTTVEEKPADEVAKSLKMNIASVYQAKSRVLRRIRKRMGELP